MTTQEITIRFKNELQKLLSKYGASIEVEDHYQGHPDAGEDIRMTVYIPAIYDKNGEALRGHTEINLGRRIKSYLK